MRSMKMTYLKAVTTLELFPVKCVGCGMCLEVCPHEVFILDDGKAAIYEKDACMECGACAMNCPAGAIDVDAGVGCAAAIIATALRGDKAVCC